MPQTGSVNDDGSTENVDDSRINVSLIQQHRRFQPQTTPVRGSVGSTNAFASMDHQPILYDVSSASNNNEDTDDDLYNLRQKLKYFFMDPLQKWRVKGRKPWKLFIQILKIMFVTAQVIVFGSDMAKFITYQDEMQMTFRQLFLKDWDPSADTLGYPGPDSPYAVYTKPEFYGSINYAIRIFSDIPELTVGSFRYTTNDSKIVSPIKFCVGYYERAEFSPSDLTYNYSISVNEDCVTIENYADAGDKKWDTFDIAKTLKKQINFETLIGTTLVLPLRTIHIEEATSGETTVACSEVDIAISMKNKHRGGQITISLESRPKRFDCVGELTDGRNVKSDLLDLVVRKLLNLLVLTFCVISLALCFRSLLRAFRMMTATETVLYLHAKQLNWEDKLEFLDSWLLFIIFTDFLIISSTVMITFYDKRLLETSNYTISSLFLGIGSLMSWSGLLRYLSFFRHYNLLIVTLRRSFVHLMRFMLCTMIVYCGFCFCGWVVFGPYHFKFRQLSTTTECLFSLLNGDDMFETFVLLRSNILPIWWFSRIYLYSFVILFIYVVLSLFIALIMDAYEIIKDYDKHGFPKTPLQALYMDGELLVHRDH